MTRCVLLCLTVVLVSTSLRGDEVSELRRAKDAKIVETLLRLPGFDLETKPEAKAAVLRHLETLEGNEQYVEIVDQLSLADAAPGLVRQALAKPDSTLGVQCARLLFRFGRTAELKQALEVEKDVDALPAITVVGLAQQEVAVDWFLPLVKHSEKSLAVRVAAVQALGRLKRGEEALLALASAGELASDLQFATANVLLNSSHEAIKTEAAKHLKPPATADARPLPPLAELVQRTGEPAGGKLVFGGKGTCSKCHIVNGEGKEVGPNLSEIGTKLSREAMYVSILDPSAGVSHNFESTIFALENGQVVTGIVVSETADKIVVKTADAIQLTLNRSEIEESRKLKTSLMPNNLQALMTVEELVDVVEYLGTLKKK